MPKSREQVQQSLAWASRPPSGSFPSLCFPSSSDCHASVCCAPVTVLVMVFFCWVHGCQKQAKHAVCLADCGNRKVPLTLEISTVVQLPMLMEMFYICTLQQW